MAIYITELAALGLTYFVLSPKVASSFYSRRLFLPLKHPHGNYHIDRVYGVHRKDIYFNSLNGAELHGWLFETPGAEHIALLHHGNRVNLTTHMAPVELLLSAGLSVFIYDYQGYGRSEGKPTFQGILQDGLAARAYLADELGYNPSQIIHYGESLGCAVAAPTATASECLGVILQSGFSSFERIGKDHVPIVRIYPQWFFPQLNTAELLKGAHPPLLIMHGRSDQVVKLNHAHHLYESASEPKQLAIFPNSAHSDFLVSGDAPLFVNTIKTFIGEISPSLVPSLL